MCVCVCVCVRARFFFNPQIPDFQILSYHKPYINGNIIYLDYVEISSFFFLSMPGFVVQGHICTFTILSIFLYIVIYNLLYILFIISVLLPI